MTKRSNTLDFITNSRIIHGDKYDYSKVQYTNTHAKVTIICPIHGQFSQRPNRHLQGDGCIKCGYDQNRIKHMKGLPFYLKLSNDTHGDRYDYSHILEYTKMTDKVPIKCNEHGIFHQSFSDHIYSQSGCPKCGNRGKSISKLHDTDIFIENCSNIHLDTYDYTKVNYTLSKNHVEVICKLHGSFFVSPSNHIYNKSGCPVCNQSKGEILISNILSNIDIPFVRQHKFIDCVSEKGNHLRFDFYLPTYNTVIEFNGLQHYQPINHFGGIIAFNNQVINDNIKKKYCTKEKITLLIFSYNQTENIIRESILQKTGNPLCSSIMSL